MKDCREIVKRHPLSDAGFRLKAVLSKLVSGHNGPSLKAAITSARNGSHGRIAIDDEAIEIVITAKMVAAALITGAEGVYRIKQGELRDVTLKRERQLERLRAMREEFAAELIERVADQHKVGRIALCEDELNLILETVEGLDQAIENLDTIVERRRVQLKGSGGNFNVFERNFVVAVREIWTAITLDIDRSTIDPGLASRPVVEFAAELWRAYGFKEPVDRDLTDWLEERFRNVRPELAQIIDPELADWLEERFRNVE